MMLVLMLHPPLAFRGAHGSSLARGNLVWSHTLKVRRKAPAAALDERLISGLPRWLRRCQPPGLRPLLRRSRDRQDVRTADLSRCEAVFEAARPANHHRRS